MLDITTLAASAVAFLAPLLAKSLESGAEALGETTTKGILGKLKGWLSHPGASEALEDLRQRPNDADNQGDLRKQLKKAMEADPALADKLRDWLGNSEREVQAAGISLNAHVVGDFNTVIQVGGTGNSVQR